MPISRFNAFDLASQYLPIVGFTKADKLRDDFEITQIASKEYYELLLTTKPQSHYKSDYTQIRFWIDKPTCRCRCEWRQPHRRRIFRSSAWRTKMNKDLPKDIFKIEVPADFDKNMCRWKTKSIKSERIWQRDWCLLFEKR